MHRTGVALNYRGGRPSRQEVASEHGCFVMIISDCLFEVVILCDGDWWVFTLSYPSIWSWDSVDVTAATCVFAAKFS